MDYFPYKYIMKKSINTQEKIFEIMTHTRVGYPIEQVINLAVAYISSGSLRGAAKVAAVNASVAQDWSKQQWFSDVLDLVRFEHQKKLDGKMTALLEKSVKELEDRLTKGDVDARTGERRPVSASQIASVFATIYDKRALIRGEPTSRVERVSVDQQLNKLQDRFEKIGKATKPEETEESPSVQH